MADSALSLKAWLESLSLLRYEPLFEAHGIDERSLSLITEHDLAEIGVLLGHRRLMMQHRHHLVAARGDAEVAVAAERRQITVLYCDLVGSTPLARQLDPEEMHQLLRRFQDRCSHAVRHYGGHVEQYRGDSLEVYFGWPEAHEHAAERAVRAGLDIVAGMPALSGAPGQLSVRIGIATGLVVVGAGGDGHPSTPSAAIGDAPNLASRLLGIAEPGQIIVAPTTQRLLGRLFELVDLGEQRLKGIDEPVRPWCVTGLARSDSRFGATRHGRHTTFVGRDAELAQLQAAWQRTRDGHGLCVTLGGEAGIGKSRLTHVLREQLGGAPLWLQCQCSPYHIGSAFYPLVAQIEGAAGFASGDSVEQKLDKLEGMLLADAQELPLLAPLFAAMLALPADRYPPRMLTPQKHRELTIESLVTQTLRLAQRQPLVWVCEDMHWADPSTLATLTRLAGRLAQSAVLLLITHRPSAPALVIDADAPVPQSIVLQRLSRAHGARLANHVAGDRTLPDAVLAPLLERADGVPLFVEELTRTVLELGILQDAGTHWALAGALPALAIPSSLHDSLTARLDRLAPLKELAQTAACIGREFDEPLLSAVSQLPPETLQPALHSLLDSELVHRQASSDPPAFRFHHALVQDVAYASLLKSRRQQIHGRIAMALASTFPQRAKLQPEVLAMHLTRAGLVEQAVPQWRVAAGAAIARHRHREALVHVEAGLGLIDQLPAEQRPMHEAALLAAGSACHWVLTGYACAAAAEMLARAQALLDQVNDVRLLIQVLGGTLISSYVSADTQRSLACAHRLLAIGEASDNVDLRVTTFALAATILSHQGQFDRSEPLLVYVIAHYQADRRAAYGRINDPRVHACAWLSWQLVTVGRLDEGRELARQAIAHAEQVAEPFVLAQALSVGALAFAESGDTDEALRLCRRCITLCNEQDLPFWRNWALAHEGVAMARLGDDAGAERCIGEAIAQMQAQGGRNNLGHVRARRALSLARLGRCDEARQLTELGRAECVQTGQLLMLAELALARGTAELLDSRADTAGAAHWLALALQEARSSGMRLVAVRAATALARCWQRQGRVAAALEMLSAACAGLDEAARSPDLAEARVLRVELAVDLG